MKKYTLIFLTVLSFIACGGGSSGSSSATSTTPSSTDTGTIENGGSVGTTSTTPENGGSSSTSTTPSNTDTGTIATSNLKLALNNTGTVIEEEFNGYIVKIISSIILEELNETSQSTIAIYGIINGSATKSLLKINTNYIGSDISVAVFKDEVLVAQSEIFTVSNDNAINFGEITIN